MCNLSDTYSINITRTATKTTELVWWRVIAQSLTHLSCAHELEVFYHNALQWQAKLRICWQRQCSSRITGNRGGNLEAFVSEAYTSFVVWPTQDVMIKTNLWSPVLIFAGKFIEENILYFLPSPGCLPRLTQPLWQECTVIKEGCCIISWPGLLTMGHSVWKCIRCQATETKYSYRFTTQLSVNLYSKTLLYCNVTSSVIRYWFRKEEKNEKGEDTWQSQPD